MEICWILFDFSVLSPRRSIPRWGADVDAVGLAKIAMRLSSTVSVSQRILLMASIENLRDPAWAAEGPGACTSGRAA